MGSYALRGFLVRQLLDKQTASLETVVENALIIILRPPVVVGTLMEISSRTPRFAIAVIRSLVSSPVSLTITSGYDSLRECTPEEEIISLSAQ